MFCKQKVILVTLFVSLWLLSHVANASAKEGFFIGAQTPSNMVGGDFDGKVDFGGGIGLIAGYAFSPNFALEIDWSATSHRLKSGGLFTTISMGEFSLNGKFNFLTTPRHQPFLFAGVGNFVIGNNNRMLGGTGYNLGIGYDSYVTPNMSIGGGLIRKIITYDKVIKSDVPGTVLRKDSKGDTTSFRVDVTYHF